MGNFYTNYSLPGVTQSAVAAALAGRSALVAPAVNNIVVVFDMQSESQDTAVINALAAKLSSTCKCPVLATMNHDDDILWYSLFTDGKMTDEYNSCPGYFDDTVESDGPSGGDVAKLAAAFNATDTDAIQTALHAPDGSYVFAVERHADLAAALGLPPFVVGGGFRYLSKGAAPDGLSQEDLIRTS